jgi:hypothetical protein
VRSCRPAREERGRGLPGDSLVRVPMASWTHAITIDAPAADVWPWLAQLGAGRGGWYSYDFVDNRGHRSATTILPALQQVMPGDVLPAVPGATDAFVVDSVETARSLVLTALSADGSPIMSWAMVLEDVANGRTRLLVRVRASDGWRESAMHAGNPVEPGALDRIYRLLARLPTPLLLMAVRTGHSIMQTRMLRGIARRCNARARSSGSTTWRPA